jgi:hypothetical protein
VLEPSREIWRLENQLIEKEFSHKKETLLGSRKSSRELEEGN